MRLLLWLEQTGLSVWIRESPTLWAFPFILFLHTLGLGLLVGINVAFNIWVVGFADRFPVAPLERLFPVMWAGFWVNAVSGVLLLIAYPAKALTDEIFYLKLALITACLVQLNWLRERVFREASPSLSTRVRVVAVLALVCWAGAILAGRLLAYTYNVLMASEAFF